MTLRRDFLASTAGAVAARTVQPAAARADNADAELIALCAEIARLATELPVPVALPASPGREAAITANEDRRQALCGRAAAIPATTLAGAQARARAMRLYLAALVLVGPPERQQTSDDLMLRAPAAELLGEARA